jgi:hypothetical protein
MLSSPQQGERYLNPSIGASLVIETGLRLEKKKF